MSSLDAPVFRVGEALVTRREVLRWARRFDPDFVARATRRSALGARYPEVADEADAEVEEAAAEFRYARGLESPEALVEWLTVRGLSVETWWEAVRQSVLERRCAGQPLPPAPADRDDAVDADTLNAALVVTDLLAASTRALAHRIAVAMDQAQWSPPAAEAGAGAEAALDARHDALEALWVPWRAALMTDDALRRAVARDRLGWIVLDLVHSRWPNVEAAREAIACVRVDALNLADVAREAGVPADERTCLLVDVPGALHDAVLTAAPGELVGPIEQPPHWAVALLCAKRPASLAEPLVRGAAERAVETRAVTPLVRRHIVWLESGP